MRSCPPPPHPDFLRRPDGGFGWLDDRLLHDAWLRDVGPDATAILVLLALAADRRGASFYGRDRMTRALGMDRARLDAALDRLLHARLVALRPWRPRGVDGVWQLLPLPERRTQTRIVTIPRPGTSKRSHQAAFQLKSAVLPASRSLGH
jgi:hypothetical protein